jgi:molybdopterin-guanine dinucleotide biosynthesis protein A
LLFAAAADMPNLEPSFIERLEDRFDSSVRDGMQPDAVLPVWPDGRTEPLAALYSSTALRDAATAGLKAGVRKVMAAVERLRVVTYPLEAGDAAMLANVNTPSDYEAFLR